MKACPIERLKLECLIGDIEGDVLLLDIVIDDVFRQELKDGPGTVEGYTTLALNRDQVTALHHAKGRAFQSAMALRDAFYVDERSAAK
jgi:hypothetical protein